MGEFDHWHALEEFSVDEAALLIAKINPGSVISKIMFRKSDQRYVDYYSVKKVLVEAILSSELDTEIRYGKKDCYQEWDVYVECDEGIPDWNQTKIAKKDIKNLLQKKNISSEFFSTKGSDQPDDLNPQGPQYTSRIDAPTIGVDSCQALKAERDDLKKRLEEAIESINALKEENESIKAECASLKEENEFIKAERDSLKAELAEIDEPSDQSKKTYLNIIAALLDCVRGKPSSIAKQIPFDSDEKLIKEVAKLYRGYYGLSESTLSHKFPEAKRSLKNL